MSQGLELHLEGDWDRAVFSLQNLAKKLNPSFKSDFDSDAEYVLETLKNHIVRQDLGWVPLSEHTIQLKGGSKTIMIETCTLLNSFEVKPVSGNDYSLFVGVDSGSHPSGEDVQDIMMWLEYGTDKMPPRPLIRPTIEEVEDEIKKHWRELFEDLLKGDK